MIFIDPQHYQDEQEKLIEDIVPAADLDIDDPTVRAREPAQVRLTARRLGSEILIQGQVHVTLEAQCGRCAEWIAWPVHLTDFAASLPMTDAQPIDLTPNLREDILLALPVVTVCPPGAQYPCAQHGKLFPGEEKPPASLHEDVWQVLDRLKPKTKD